MKTLLIMRHGKSSWDNPGLADHDRPLNQRGKRDAPRMGRLLRHEGLVPDLILSSTARRALTTAEAVAETSGYDEMIEVSQEFYPGDPDSYLTVLQLVGDDVERLLIIGHNPGLEEFLEGLTGRWERLPTAAIAQVSLPVGHWRDLDQDTVGRLENLWLARDLQH